MTGDEAQKTVLVDDMAAGQYIASAGQGEVEELPGSNNGLLFRNSRVAFRDVTDGLSQTLLVGERSRNLADATWVGAVASGHVCTNPRWPVRDCATSNVMVMANTGPWPDEPWVNVPNHKDSKADDYWSLHPGGCNFLLGDGSVRFIKETVNPTVFSALASRWAEKSSRPNSSDLSFRQRRNSMTVRHAACSSASPASPWSPRPAAHRRRGSSRSCPHRSRRLSGGSSPRPRSRSWTSRRRTA